MKLLKDFIRKHTPSVSASVYSLLMTLVVIFLYVAFGKIITLLFIFILIFELCYLTILALTK